MSVVNVKVNQGKSTLTSLKCSILLQSNCTGVAGQHQTFLDEADNLDPFHYGLRLGYGTETTLVALVVDLHQEMDRGKSLYSP